MKTNRSYILYVLLIALVSAFLWYFFGPLAMPILIVIGSIMLIVTNDIKYLFPSLINLIFVNKSLAASTDIGIFLYISAGVFLAVIIYYFIRNKIKIRLNSFGLIILILSALSIIPLIWSRPNDIAFYLLYFGWLLYFAVYLFFTNTTKNNKVYEFSLGMEGLSTLLSLETVMSVIYIWMNKTQSLDDIYTLGWGICNEAGIMLCVAMPFIFYLIYNSLGKKEMIFHICSLAVAAIGCVATLSRGTFLFAAIEGVCLLLYLLIKKKQFILAFVCLGIGILGIGAFVFLKHEWILAHMINFFDDNGRFEYYELTIDQINSSPLKAILGGGFAHHYDFYGNVIVCHSTIYETLAVMGFVGLAVLLVLIALKYYHCVKGKDAFGMFMLIGFVIVDMYGLIDNTYHMYYFTIILVMILSVMENRYKEVE